MSSHSHEPQNQSISKEKRVFRYCFVITAALFYLLVPVYAQETENNDINVVIFAATEKKVQIKKLPDCQDANIKKFVLTQINQYYQNNPATSIIGRRQQSLLLKNLKDFYEIPLDSFDNASNYATAQELIMTKINYGLTNDELRLCHSDKKNVYLLMNLENDGVKIQIINLPISEKNGKLSAYYHFPEVSADKPAP